MGERLYLIAHLGEQAVAIDSEHVDSVVDLGEITPAPRAAPTVLGLAALRSRVVTVISTRQALGMEETGVIARAIITRADGHHYAMLVDSLEDIVPLEMTPLSNAIQVDSAWRSAARGVVEREGEPVLVIDPAALLPLGTAVAVRHD